MIAITKTGISLGMVSGAEAEWLVQQITVDSVFLRDLCVMDYSLLIGRQTLHQSELSQTKSEVVTKIWR